MKIGVSVITCNRPEMFRNLMHSLQQCHYDELVVINDTPAEAEQYTWSLDALALGMSADLQKTGGVGVGRAKNAALQHLLDKGCDYIFLIEDDMLILREDIFDAYIAASKETGIQHFMMHSHGPANKLNGKSNPRLTVEYKTGISISLFTHCVGSFCMYTRRCLNTVGLMDPVYKNAWEHISHSYDIIKAGMIPAYWWWPDITSVSEFITEQACSENNSVIRPRTDWKANIEFGWNHFIDKHGFGPTAVPDTREPEIIHKLKEIRRKFGENHLCDVNSNE